MSHQCYCYQVSPQSNTRLIQVPYKYQPIKICFSSRSSTVIFSSSLSSRNFSTVTKAWLFTSFWRPPTFLFFRQAAHLQTASAAGKSWTFISQALIVSGHSPFLSKQIFNIVSLVSIVVTLNASPSLYLFEFNPNTKETIGLKEETMFCFASNGATTTSCLISSGTDFLARLI